MNTDGAGWLANVDPVVRDKLLADARAADAVVRAQRDTYETARDAAGTPGYALEALLNTYAHRVGWTDRAVAMVQAYAAYFDAETAARAAWDEVQFADNRSRWIPS